MKITRFLELYRAFGADIAFSALAGSRFRSASSLKHKCILRWLKAHYSGLIASYADKQTLSQGDSTSPERPNPQQTDSNIPAVWTIWWQGTENLPEVVKICYASFRKYCGTHPVKVLTRKNFTDYVDLPGYIFDRLDSGAITITHLSDIMRFYLLYHYGGLWLDSTIYITNGIPASVFGAEYYTVKRHPRPRNRSVAKDRWANFLVGAKKGSVLCSFMLDFFLEYWRTQEKFIDYFLLDYVMNIAYDELTECRKILDSVPYSDYDLYRLESIMNHEWSAEEWEALKNSTHFSKLAWRKPGKMTTLLGKDTIYSHLLAESAELLQIL
ncbi:MAG: capsular polysaccharide synthesis protein [Synergistaceae bacterium]|nr:capsular polysaccharide synthesis protein [Synergistaceae bacterium]